MSTVIMMVIAARLLFKAPKWIDEKIEGILSTFLEPDAEGKNLVDQIGDRFGQGFRMSLLAKKSGEVRHEKAIEKRVFSAVVDKSPEIKIGMKVLSEFGLEDLATPENMPALLSIANKYGLFNMIPGKNNSPGVPDSRGKM